MHFDGSLPVAALPVRSFSDGKRRLSATLSPAIRGSLVRYLAHQVLSVLQNSGVIATCAFVSGDEEVLMWAERQGAVALREESPSLNGAARTACRWGVEHGATALLLMLPDLPLVAPEEIRDLVVQSRPQSVIMAPDRHGTGTNALLLRPPDLLQPAFGPDSLRYHREAATQRQLLTQLCLHPGLAFDLDTPADLANLPADDKLWDIVARSKSDA